MPTSKQLFEYSNYTNLCAVNSHKILSFDKWLEFVESEWSKVKLIHVRLVSDVITNCGRQGIFEYDVPARDYAEAVKVARAKLTRFEDQYKAQIEAKRYNNEYTQTPEQQKEAAIARIKKMLAAEEAAKQKAIARIKKLMAA